MYSFMYTYIYIRVTDVGDGKIYPDHFLSIGLIALCILIINILLLFVLYRISSVIFVQSFIS
jgi:hypothetical protein